jgi:hypothetical protein
MQFFDAAGNKGNWKNQTWSDSRDPYQVCSKPFLSIG